MKYRFPRNAYFGNVQFPYEVLGEVKSKVDYVTLDPDHEERDLCKNYFNQAVQKLTEYAKSQGGDAVIDVKSIVFYFDGKSGAFSRAECTDSGAEGQVLVRGIAIKWKTSEKKTEKKSVSRR